MNNVVRLDVGDLRWLSRLTRSEQRHLWSGEFEGGWREVSRRQIFWEEAHWHAESITKLGNG